jgi:diguanylate cyclase (GGDEF)-like protein/PAS domain S-box-containing protein
MISEKITASTNKYRGDILIVDDLPENLRLLRDALTEHGYKVRSATTGAMAIRAAQSPATELILLDIKLPDLDGYEVCRRLKSDDRTAEIPIIFLSALNESFNRIQGLEIGGVDYISKPFQIGEVLARVNTHLTIGQLQKSLKSQNQSLLYEIEENQRLKASLFEEKELAQVTLQSIGDGVITVDLQANIKYLNSTAEQLTGWMLEEASQNILTQVFVVIDKTTRIPVANLMDRAVIEGYTIRLTSPKILMARNGTECLIDAAVSPIRDRYRKIIGAVIVFHDVTESHNLSHQLTWTASHDVLTGLINRRRFEQYLSEAIASVHESEQHHVFCHLDLDHFKVINDTAGYIAGDELIRQIAAILQKGVRANDMLARLGDDEFGLLLTQCSLPKAVQIAEQLKTMIHQFRFDWDENVYSVGVSIGVVAIDSTSQNLNQVLGAANVACSAAKNKGRNLIHIYRSHDVELIKEREERNDVTKIRYALENNLFCLYFQKIASIKPQPLTIRYEILLRMLSESGKIIAPNQFIPAAERYGLITEIDQWVVQKFFANYDNLASQKTAIETIYAINLSGSSICSNIFLKYVLQQFSIYQIPPQNISFEITETAAISNFERAVHFINTLKNIGCHFALDDFGSGLSSFAYLMNLPVDYLKIDGMFVKNICTDPTSSAIVEGFNQIAHAMNLQTVAEFVENQAIVDKLQEIGVDYVQGYEIGHPIPLSQLISSRSSF